MMLKLPRVEDADMAEERGDAAVELLAIKIRINAVLRVRYGLRDLEW